MHVFKAVRAAGGGVCINTQMERSSNQSRVKFHRLNQFDSKHLGMLLIAARVQMCVNRCGSAPAGVRRRNYLERVNMNRKSRLSNFHSRTSRSSVEVQLRCGVGAPIGD